MHVIGITGRNGAGKDTVGRYLKKMYGVSMFSAGDVVRDIVREKNLDASREHLHRVSSDYLQEHGRDALMKILLKKAQRQQLERVSFVGIRSPEEVEYLRDRLKSYFLLIAVVVDDIHVRYQRTQTRREERDQLTLGEFQRQDCNEQNLYHVENTIALADVRVNNDDGLSYLYEQLDATIPEFIFNNLK